MGHRAGSEFFDRKREWSERKDKVLSEYLPPYVQKVAHALGRPVCVVDGFAGPGSFRDGKPGSPLIIRGALAEARLRPGVQVEALFIERDPELAAALRGVAAEAPWITVREGSFLEQIDEIERLAATRSVFLYLDPYTVEGLEWAALDRVFQKINQGRSVEVLLNFNADSFARRGLAALKSDASVPAPDPDDPDADPQSSSGSTSLAHLDSIVGGDWWREILRRDGSYEERVRGLLAGFADRLRTRFPRVCAQNVYALAFDRLPKYALVFGSRSREALLLMNDAMVAAREMLAVASTPAAGVLFDNRREEIVPDRARLSALILERSATARPRIDVIEDVVRDWIGGWRRKEIRGEIESLLRAGKLRSATGRPRIPDEEQIWRP